LLQDIAQRAEVGKGTIYLHWKTREELFIALLLRERLRAINEAEQRLADDPEGTNLHAAVKYVTLDVLTNPLLRATIQQDTPPGQNCRARSLCLPIRLAAWLPRASASNG
jgi:AcrR family transcriptional regulator